MNKKCVIIPVYNEERNIASVIEGIRDDSDVDIIVIDDGSNDSSAEIARAKKAFVISHPFNMGYGIALQTGYKYATKNHYDLLVQMDGDGQHKGEYVSQLFNRLEDNICDVVIGSRFLSQDHYKPGIPKVIGIAIFRLIIAMTTGLRITDPTSGYQGLRREVFEFFSADHFPWDYPDANVIIMLHRAGFRVKEISVEMVPNSERRSMHQGLLKISCYLFKVFLSILVTLIRKKARLRIGEGA